LDYKTFKYYDCFIVIKSKIIVKGGEKMEIKKIILSIICFIGLIGLFGSLFYSLIIIVVIFLEGSIWFIEPNLSMLTIELIMIVISVVSFPIIVASTTKNVFFKKNS